MFERRQRAKTKRKKEKEKGEKNIRCNSKHRKYLKYRKRDNNKVKVSLAHDFAGREGEPDVPCDPQMIHLPP